MVRALNLLSELHAMTGLGRDVAAARDAVAALIEADGELALARTHHVPGHVTASALVVDPAGERVLLVWHRFLGCWLQPGGHVDASDGSVLHAALREVREETGLVVQALGGPIHLDVHHIPGRPSRGEPAHLHHDVRWLVRSGDQAPRAGDDVAEARWFRWHEISSLDTDESVRTLVEAARRTLGNLGADGRARDASAILSSASRDRRG